MAARHDPEIVALQRESLRLIIASEKVLAALEDHLSLLRTFVQSLHVEADTAGDAASQTVSYHLQEADDHGG